MVTKAAKQQSLPTPDKGMRRLGFIRDMVAYTASLVAPVVQQVQGLGDNVLERLGRKESLASYTTPLLEKSTDLGDSVLSSVDQQVDYMITTGKAAVSYICKNLTDSVQGVRDIHTANLAFLSNAFQTYLTTLQRATDWAVDNLNPVRAARAAWEWAASVLARLQELLDPDTLYKFLHDRWAAFASIPMVSGVLDTLQPITNAFWSIFVRLHDVLVSSGLYKFAVDTWMASWNWVQDSSPYKLGAQYLYPIVQPVANPTLDKLTHSKVINSALDYWRPTTSPVA